MKMLLTLVLLCIFSKNSYADLAEVLNCSVNTKDKQCTSILIGHIDALSNLGIYCADGNTSYSFIVEAWARDMKLNSENNKNTTESLKRTLHKLNLLCKNK